MINLHISYKKIKATDPLTEHIEHKAELLEKHVTYPLEIFVVVSVQKLDHMAEVTCHAEHRDLVAVVKTENLYEAIDMAFKKVETQLKKEREKHKGHHRGGAAMVSKKILQDADKLGLSIPHRGKRSIK